MANDERRKRIMEHLKRSGNIQFDAKGSGNTANPSKKIKTESAESFKTSNISESKPQTLTSDTSTTPATPSSYKTPDSRKQKVMDHLNRSGSGYSLLSSDSEKRKQKIQSHVRKSTQ